MSSQLTVQPVALSSSDMRSTSVMRGTFSNRWVPSASSEAAMSLSALFLAPPTRTVPSSEAPPLTTMRRSVSGTDPGTGDITPKSASEWQP